MPMPVPGTDFDPAEHPAAPEDHPLLAAAEATQWGLDYAWQRDTPAQLVALLRANGADFAARYLSDEVPGGKGITAAEARALTAAGITIVPTWEVTGTDFGGGYNAGVSDGRAAAQALRALGAPTGTCCWFAVDTDTSAFAAVTAYLRGCQAGAGGYNAQLYGSYAVVEAAAAAGLGGKHWQTYAWSRGRVSAHAALYQYQNGVTIGGISMDRDRSLQPISGPWAHFGGPAGDWTEEAVMALPTLKQGDRDAAGGAALMVHRAQICVAGIGRWNNLGAVTAVADDGNFGPSTTAAVKAVQKFFGLAEDGIVGPDTWRKLIGVL